MDDGLIVKHSQEEINFFYCSGCENKGVDCSCKNGPNLYEIEELKSTFYLKFEEKEISPGIIRPADEIKVKGDTVTIKTYYGDYDDFEFGKLDDLGFRLVGVRMSHDEKNRTALWLTVMRK